MRKVVLLAFVALMAPDAARAETTLCLDPHKSYEAHVVGDHDVVAWQTIGTRRDKVRLTTSCATLHPADRVTLGGVFICVGKGDPVAVVTANGNVQACMITKVAPFEGQPPHQSSNPDSPAPSPE
jgi:hypothetical protein